MKDLKIIQKNTRLLLTKYPHLRNLETRKLAIYRYWEDFEEIGGFGITKSKWLTLTNPETISRAIRKCQEIYPELRPDIDNQIKRYERTNEFSEFYKPKE